MAGEGQRLLGKYYGKDQITHGEIEELGLKVVTAEGREVQPEDLRDRVFRVEDPEEPSGYVVRSMEDETAGHTLAYLQERS